MLLLTNSVHRLLGSLPTATEHTLAIYNLRPYPALSNGLIIPQSSLMIRSQLVIDIPVVVC